MARPAQRGRSILTSPVTITALVSGGILLVLVGVYPPLWPLLLLWAMPAAMWVGDVRYARRNASAISRPEDQLGDSPAGS